MDPLVDYYTNRAPKYESIWYRDDPVRQGEQTAMALAIEAGCHGRRVLEVACGTGYWTRFAAAAATEVVALDLSPKMLALARAKNLIRTTFIEGNAYELAHVPGPFTAGLANFWFSHIPKRRIVEFLDGFHRQLSPGARVFMADNVFVPGVGGELVSRPGTDDTFKLRELTDGSRHEVLKNYYDAAQLREFFQNRGIDLEIKIGKSFWWLSYATNES